MNDKPQTPNAAQENPQEKKEYHAPQVRDFGTLRGLTNFSENEDGNIDYAYTYATVGY